MDDWVEEMWRSLYEVAHNPEGWVESLSERLNEASKALVQVTDEWAEWLQQSVEPEVARVFEQIYQAIEPIEAALDTQAEEISAQMNQIIDPMLEDWMMGLGQWVETVSAPVHHVVDPIVQNKSTCIGCRHYYGQVHGSNRLVCAMHPFGPEGEECPDWQHWIL